MATWIYKWSRSITRIFYGRHRDDVDVTQTFSYTWADQHFTIPAWSDVTFEVKWWWSNNSAWWISTWKKHFDEETELSIMVWWNWGRTNNWTTYWFGWSTTYGWRWWWGLSWVFTWSGAIWANDAARALIIAGWAWGWLRWAWAWGWTNWQNWNSGSYWYMWAWWTQTWRWSWGNTRSEQFRWWGWSWTYWFGWGGWWRWGNWSWWDWSWDDDAQAWWGSWYIWRVENWTTTVWWGSAAWTDWTAKIQYTKQWLFPTEYVEWWLWDTQIFPNQWGRLPSSYQEVRYIQSTATNAWDAASSWQYIDTLVTINKNIKVEIDMQFTSLAVQSRLFWWLYDSWSSWITFWPYINWSSQRARATSNGTWNWQSTNVSVNSNRNKFVLDNSSYIIYNSDGTIAYNAANSATITNNDTWTIPLLASKDRTQNKVNRHSSAKLYWCKIWDNWILVRDFVPCYRKSDNKVWLYDIVNHVFYINSWSWDFTAWPIPNKTRYIRCYVNWSNVNTSNHFVELKAMVWSTNVALNKSVTIVRSTLYSGTPKQPAAFVDWDTNTNNYVDLTSNSTWGWLQVDLWQVYDLESITIRHYYSDWRVYNQNVIQISEDWDERTTIFDSSVNWTYSETSSWKTITL